MDHPNSYSSTLIRSNRSTADGTEHGFEFHGQASEYFFLELKNVLLTILSLGIYSAWATVARRKYLASSTFVDGHAFDYVADPKVILRSRIVMLFVLGAAFASSAIDETVTFFTFFALFLCIPWAITASLAFHAKNTVHRGARFSFDATTKASYAWYFKLLALQVCTLGLAFPLLHRYTHRFMINQRTFGEKPFHFQAPLKPFVKLTFLYIATVIVPLGVLVLLSLIDANPTAYADTSLWGLTELGAATPLLILAVYFFVIFSCGFVLARSTNLIYNHSRLGEHRFESTQRGVQVGFLWMSNLFLIALTSGLAYPWAMIRVHRYRFANLKIHAKTPLMEGVQLDSNPGSHDDSDAHGAALVDFTGGLDFGI